MPKKIIEEVIEDLAILENEEVEEVEEPEEVEDDEEIQAKPKIKKPRSEAQIAAFKKTIEIRAENRKRRAEEKKIQEAKDKVELEQKIIKKAVSIKKKELKKQIVLDEISDDDENIEVIKNRVMKSKVALANQPKPLSINFF